MPSRVNSFSLRGTSQDSARKVSGRTVYNGCRSRCEPVKTAARGATRSDGHREGGQFVSFLRQAEALHWLVSRSMIAPLPKTGVPAVRRHRGRLRPVRIRQNRWLRSNIIGGRPASPDLTVALDPEQSAARPRRKRRVTSHGHSCRLSAFLFAGPYARLLICNAVAP